MRQRLIDGVGTGLLVVLLLVAGTPLGSAQGQQAGGEQFSNTPGDSAAITDYEGRTVCFDVVSGGSAVQGARVEIYRQGTYGGNNRPSVRYTDESGRACIRLWGNVSSVTYIIKWVDARGCTHTISGSHTWTPAP